MMWCFGQESAYCVLYVYSITVVVWILISTRRSGLSGLGRRTYKLQLRPDLYITRFVRRYKVIL